MQLSSAWTSVNRKMPCVLGNSYFSWKRRGSVREYEELKSWLEKAGGHWVEGGAVGLREGSGEVSGLSCGAEQTDLLLSHLGRGSKNKVTEFLRTQIWKAGVAQWSI